jgi:hypothetical protein
LTTCTWISYFIYTSDKFKSFIMALVKLVGALYGGREYIRARGHEPPAPTTPPVVPSSPS